MTLKDDIEQISVDLAELGDSMKTVAHRLSLISAKIDTSIVEGSPAAAKSSYQPVPPQMPQARQQIQPQPQPQRWIPPVKRKAMGLPPIAPRPTMPQPTTPQPTAPRPTTPPPPMPMVSAQGRKSRPWWQNERTVTRILAGTGAFITLAGIAFLVALAIQNGILGPLGRVILAFIIAVALFGTGAWIHSSQRSNPGVNALLFSSYLTAAITFSSLTYILDWWPTQLQLLAQVVLLVSFLAVSRKWEKHLFSIILLIPGFMMLSFDTRDSWPLVASAVVVVAALVLARARDWPWLQLLAPGLYAAAVWIQSLNIRSAWQSAVDLGQPTDTLNFTYHFATVATILAVFTIIALMYLSEQRFGGEGAPAGHLQFRRQALWVPPAVGVITASSTIADWPDHYMWMLVLLAMLALSLVLAVRLPGCGMRMRNPMTLSALCAATLFSFSVSQRPMAWILMCTAITLVLLYRNLPDLMLPALPAIAVTAVTFRYIETILLAWKISPSAGYHAVRLDQLNRPEQILDSLLLAVLAGSLMALLSRQNQVTRPSISIAAFGFWLMSAPIVLLTTAVGHSAGMTSSAAFLFGHTLVSVTWMCTAASLLLWQRWPLQESTSLSMGFALASIATAKLIFFDLAELTGLARVMAFIVCGILLLGMATWRSKQARPGKTATQGKQATDEWAL